MISEVFRRYHSHKTYLSVLFVDWSVIWDLLSLVMVSKWKKVARAVSKTFAFVRVVFEWIQICPCRKPLEVARNLLATYRLTLLIQLTFGLNFTTPMSNYSRLLQMTTVVEGNCVQKRKQLEELETAHVTELFHRIAFARNFPSIMKMLSKS
jgi:hypothetical protein